MIIPANPGITVAFKLVFAEEEETALVVAWDIDDDTWSATALCINREGQLRRVDEHDATMEYARFEFPRGRVA